MAGARYVLLLFLVTQISQMTQIFLRGRVLSHRFHRFTQIFFIGRFFIGFHGRIGRHSCLSDYSRIFADIWPLANGSRQICAAIVFCHADFADDADFSSWDYFVPQISQIYTDFFESQVNLFVQSQGVSVTTEQVASAKFRVIR